MITHPTTTTHIGLSAEEKAQSGITDALLRLSVGIEHQNDLIYDLDQAMRSANNI